VQAKYTLFTAEGTPIRATCNVAMEEMPGDPLKQNPTSGGHALTSVRTVVSGDSLASIAYAEYGDPTLWRPLAAFNGVDDPLRLRPGAALLLPVVDDLLAGV
jgi:nucleoid-associated protein YgaU